MKVDQSEWDTPVVAMSLGQFKQALSESSAVSGKHPLWSLLSMQN